MLVPAIIALVAGYVIGAVPVAWILVRRRHGIDMRTRTGGSSASSALFVAGPRTALAAGILECAKGAVVGLGARLYSPSGWFIAVALAGCVLGDAFPAGFRRGGRGLLPLVTGMMVALPTAGLITAIAAVPAALLTSMRGRIFDTVVAVAVPVGLLLGTRDWRSLIPAAIIVAALLSRRAIRRRQRGADLIREPSWRTILVDSADLPVYEGTPTNPPGRQNRGPWGTS